MGTELRYRIELTQSALSRIGIEEGKVHEYITGILVIERFYGCESIAALEDLKTPKGKDLGAIHGTLEEILGYSIRVFVD